MLEESHEFEGKDNPDTARAQTPANVNDLKCILDALTGASHVDGWTTNCWSCAQLEFAIVHVGHDSS